MFKGYSFADVLKLTTTVKMTPKPFPGKYPTRIAWEVSYPGIAGVDKPTTERYVGKPSYNSLLGFWALNLKYVHVVGGLVSTFTEFDMAHVVGATISKQSWTRNGVFFTEAIPQNVENAPLGRNYRNRYWVTYISGVSERLMRYYHPNARGLVGAFEIGGRVVTSAWRTGNEKLGVQKVYVEMPAPKRVERDNWRARLVGVEI